MAIDEKLKAFILSKLREQGDEDLLRIIKKSKVEYNSRRSHIGSNNHACVISISDDTEVDMIYKNKYVTEISIKRIVIFAKNIEREPLSVRFVFDLEAWEDYGISNADEDVGGLMNDKNIMLDRYKTGDYNGAITLAKAMLESVYKTLLTKKGEKYPKNVTFDVLQEKVFNILNDGKSTYYSNFLKGFSEISKGVNQTRNNEADSHGLEIGMKKTPESMIVKMIIEASISLTHYVLYNMPQEIIIDK